MTDAPSSAGTRVRAGNAMGRTRVALLEAALTAIEKHGVRRSTMADIAAVANVAKGTVYNHFRTKDEVYAAAAANAVALLADRAAAVAAVDGLGAGLAVAAEGIATSSVLARLRADEPSVIGELMSVAAADSTRAAVAAVLAAGGVEDDASTEVALRWLIGYVAASVDLASLAAVAERVAAGLVGAEPLAVL